MNYQQRLLEHTTAPGDSYWYRGECIRRPYAPVNVCKDNWSWDDMIAAPPTPRIAYLQARYPLAGLMRTSLRG